MKDRCLFIGAGEYKKVLIHLCNPKAPVNMLEQHCFYLKTVTCMAEYGPDGMT